MSWRLRPPVGSIIFLYCLTAAVGESRRYSDLWGRGGEKWTPAGRLPDFSFAGYRHGERPIPRVKTAVTVTQFGAKGDGKHDDTKAFVAAIAKIQRGEKTLAVSAVAGLKVGQYVEVRQTDMPDNSLAKHLYAGQPGDTRNLRGRMRTSLVARITAVGDKRITLDRGLRCDVRLQWRPQILCFAPTVTEVGVENLTFEAVRQPDSRGHVGHHGLSFGGDDNLFTDFDFKVRFIHDITVAWHTGNVASNGRGVDLCFDHHRAAPYANLLTNIDIGRGTRMFACGGGGALGVHSGAWETFWCIRSQRPQSWPPRGFGPDRMNLIGVQTTQPTVKTPAGKWFEAIDPAKLSPRDLHAAQLKRRLRTK